MLTASVRLWHDDPADDHRNDPSGRVTRAVPTHYYEGSLALGATHERSIFRIVIPSLQIRCDRGDRTRHLGRAIGETMAVIMVAGNQARMPVGILKGVRTLTANIVIEMGYATDLHRGGA